MQGTHPNTKSTVKFASWLWITTFKQSHLLRIWAPRHTQEAWGWHLRLIVGHGSLPSTHSMLHVISCLQYFIHNLCLSLHAFLSLHTMFRLHLLLGIPSPSYCLPNSSLSQDSAGTSLPSESPPGCLSGTIDTFLLLSLPPCMHLIYTWPRHSAQCPTHIVKSKTKCTQMKCYWFCISSPKFTAVSMLREIKCLAYGPYKWMKVTELASEPSFY